MRAVLQEVVMCTNGSILLLPELLLMSGALVSSVHFWCWIWKQPHNLPDQLLRLFLDLLLSCTFFFFPVSPALSFIFPFYPPLPVYLSFLFLFYISAPSYISDLLSPYERRHSHIPKSKLKTKRDRAFAIKTLRLWNGLPEIRLSDSVPIFKSLLKTHFYKDAFNVWFLINYIFFILLPPVFISLLVLLFYDVKLLLYTLYKVIIICYPLILPPVLPQWSESQHTVCPGPGLVHPGLHGFLRDVSRPGWRGGEAAQNLQLLPEEKGTSFSPSPHSFFTK